MAEEASFWQGVGGVLDGDFLSDKGAKFELGKILKDGVDWISKQLADPISAFSDGLEGAIDGLIDALKWCPALILIFIFAGIAHYMQRSWALTLATAAAFLGILNLGYWDQTLETLALILFATLTSIVIGVPLGIAAAHRPWLWNALRPVLDLMQTIPTFVYLIPTLVLFGLGVVPGVLSTVVFAIPAPIRLTYLGISAVPKPLIEAGEAFGATRRQLLWKVEVPHAMPTITAGITQCIMLSLSMVVIAALVGAAGLGVPVVRALNSLNIAVGFESGLAIVALAILLDRICKQRKPKGGE